MMHDLVLPSHAQRSRNPRLLYDSGVELLTLRLRIQLLPIDVDIRVKSAFVQPLHSHFVGTRVAKGLHLNRRQKTERHDAGRPRLGGRRSLQRPHDEAVLLAADGKRHDGPHQLKGSLTACAGIGKDTELQVNLFSERDL